MRIESLLLAWLLALAAAADPPPVEKPPADNNRLVELRRENQRLHDILSAAEARLSLLAEKVFSSRLVVHYQGELDSAYRLEQIELLMDGDVVYRQALEKAPAVLGLLLFDGYLPPGPHTLELKLRARGPDAGAEGPASHLAGSGLMVHLREKSTSRVEFEADLDGDASAGLLRDSRPEAEWKVEIRAGFSTREGK